MVTSRASFGIGVLLASLGLATIAGCSGEPAPPPRFQLDPQHAAQEAMKLYDKNDDGVLDAKELHASPPLLELLKNVQGRSPGHPESLTEADISGRLKEWVEATATLFPGTAMVFLDGKMLEGATVTFEPEPFLGSSYHAHQGQTNATGSAELDRELANYPGIYVGLYRVRISKKINGKETLPSRYNMETELGREVAAGVRDNRGNVMFRLTSK
jgi:hypothetical protein